jgi:hypothetical protein
MVGAASAARKRFPVVVNARPDGVNPADARC